MPSRCRPRTPRASPASSAKSSRSRPTASPWSAPTAASRSPACSRTAPRRSTPPSSSPPPSSHRERASPDYDKPRHRRLTTFALNGNILCPPRSIRIPKSDIDIAQAAKPRPIMELAKEKLGIASGKSRALRPLQGQGVDELYQVAAKQAERQADPGDRHHADAGRRGQDHDHRGPDRRAQQDRQEGDAVPARAIARALLRRQRRRRRRRLRPGGADGRHQSAFHRRFPRHRLRQQSALRADRQPHLLGQFARHRRPPRHLAPRRRHERPQLAPIVVVARRRRQRLPARGRLRHHGRLRGDGGVLPRQRSRRPQEAAGQYHRRLYARPQTGARRRRQRARADDRAA